MEGVLVSPDGPSNSSVASLLLVVFGGLGVQIHAK